MSLRVAHIVLSLEIGGLEVLVYELANALVKKGHHCTIYCLDSLGTLAGKAGQDGIDVVLIGRKQGSIDFQALKRLYSGLHQNRISVVHTHNIEPLFYGSIASLFLPGAKVIHTQHGIPAPFRRNNRIKARLSGLFVDRFVGVSVNTSNFAADSRWIRPGKIITILNGINTEKFRPDPERRRTTRQKLSIPESMYVLICVARLSEIKNHARLLTVFKLLKESVPNSCLLLVGGGPLQTSIENNIDNLGLHNDVRMLGESLEIAELLSASDTFVLTSDSEGISVSILEALSSGMPAVVTDVGGNSEIVKNGYSGFCIPPQNIDAIVNKLELISADPELRNTLAVNARSHVVNNFSINSMIAAYISLYKVLSNDE